MMIFRFNLRITGNYIGVFHMKFWLLAVSAFAVIGATHAHANSPVELGQLSCEMTDRKNRIVVTKQQFDCMYTKLDGTKQAYTGEIRKMGVDLSVKDDFVIVWTVLAGKADAQSPSSIAGTYVGAAADVAVVGGVGARVLVGSGENQLSLKPVSISGVVGAGASLGFERFVLSPAS